MLTSLKYYDDDALIGMRKASLFVIISRLSSQALVIYVGVFEVRHQMFVHNLIWISFQKVCSLWTFTHFSAHLCIELCFRCRRCSRKCLHSAIRLWLLQTHTQKGFVCPNSLCPLRQIILSLSLFLLNSSNQCRNQRVLRSTDIGYLQSLFALLLLLYEATTVTRKQEQKRQRVWRCPAGWFLHHSSMLYFAVW